jgi:branched-chain amino acid transport system substrate-binding protein
MIRIESAKFLRYAKKTTKWAAGPIVIDIISFLLIQPLLKQFSGPEEYYIYVVSNFREGQDAAKDIRKNFFDNLTSLEIDGVGIVERDENDHGDPYRAENLSEELAKRDDILMIVGHFFSTTTARALPNYMKADPQIPVILTTETNPDLLPPPSPNNGAITIEEYKPIYSLSPDDNNQAEIAAKHATLVKEHENFWVVQDVNNRLYSNYLAINFIEKVQNKLDKKVVLLTDSNLIPPVGTIEKLKIDCIFFAGQWQNALILIHQINAIYEGKTRPKIILTDSCVDPKLLEQGKDAVDSVYLTHQLSYEDYENGGGWGLYGKEAANIVEQIMSGANRKFEKNRIKKWLNIHRVGDARIAIKRAMFEMFEANEHKYRKDSDFHVWQIEEVNRNDGKIDYVFKDWVDH